MVCLHSHIVAQQVPVFTQGNGEIDRFISGGQHDAMLSQFDAGLQPPYSPAISIKRYFSLESDLRLNSLYCIAHHQRFDCIE